MSLYFFDLRSAGSFSRDDVGMELPDAEAAHDMAFDALVALARDGITEGTMGQRYTIEVVGSIGIRGVDGHVRDAGDLWPRGRFVRQLGKSCAT